MSNNIRVIVAGATGWTGSVITRAILEAQDLVLVGAVARSSAGEDIGVLVSGRAAGVIVSPSVDEALNTPCDVLIDYTHPAAVKAHTLLAISMGVNVVIGTSGLGAEDFSEIEQRALEYKVGVFASGNYSLTAALMTRFALSAARYVPDVEIIDYAHETKPDTPSGTGRELAERLSAIRLPATSTPIAELTGDQDSRGATIGKVQVHSVRMPGYVLTCEAVFGAPDERLVIRHDAGSSAAPYVQGTLLAVRRVGEAVGLRRGLDQLLDG
jgi:4-hydroxy-tetrahydrodipicolinate reductase